MITFPVIAIALMICPSILIYLFWSIGRVCHLAPTISCANAKSLNEDVNAITAAEKIPFLMLGTSTLIRNFPVGIPNVVAA